MKFIISDLLLILHEKTQIVSEDRLHIYIYVHTYLCLRTALLIFSGTQITARKVSASWGAFLIRWRHLDVLWLPKQFIPERTWESIWFVGGSEHNKIKLTKFCLSKTSDVSYLDLGKDGWIRHSQRTPWGKPQLHKNNRKRTTHVKLLYSPRTDVEIHRSSVRKHWDPNLPRGLDGGPWLQFISIFRSLHCFIEPINESFILTVKTHIWIPFKSIIAWDILPSDAAFEILHCFVTFWEFWDRYTNPHVFDFLNKTRLQD